jgi:pimeloyl-ACP methyl ester carboxylesterase
MLNFSVCEKDKMATWVTFIHGYGSNSRAWKRQVEALKSHFNILLIDLRWHGKSKDLPFIKNYSFDDVDKEIIDILDHLNIKKTAMIGLSLGCYLIFRLQQEIPKRISKVVFAGAVTKMSLKTSCLLWGVNITRNLLPVMWVYRSGAFILIPKKQHKKSREFFINAASQLNSKCFKSWLYLLTRVRSKLKNYYQTPIKHQTLYISGEHDYLFLDGVKNYVKSNDMCQLIEVKGAGHIVSLDKPNVFNQELLHFLSK